MAGTVNGEDDQPIRRIARLADLRSPSRPLVDALIEKRLLLTDSRGGDPIVEVAHESLLRHWKQLVDWLRAERDDLKEADRLEQAATAWTRSSRKDDWLLEGERLTIAETLAAKPAYRRRLAEVSEFLAASRRREDRRRADEARARQAELNAARERQAAAEALAAEQQRAAAQAQADTARLRTRGRQLLAVAAAVLAFAVIAGLFAWQAQRQAALAERQLLTATALRVNSEAQAMFQGTRAGGQRLAVLKMLVAYRLAPHTEVESALASQLSSSMSVEKIFDAASVAPRVAFSPDGTRIVSAGRDRAIRLWDPDTGQPSGAPLLGHDGDVNSVLFSPDGKRIVSGSVDGTVRIWDLATGGSSARRCGDIGGRSWKLRSIQMDRASCRWGRTQRSVSGMPSPVNRSEHWPDPIPCAAWRSARTASGSWAAKFVDGSVCGTPRAATRSEFPRETKRTVPADCVQSRRYPNYLGPH